MASEAENAATRETAAVWTGENGGGSNLIGGHDGACISTTTKNQVSAEYSFNFEDVTGEIDGIEVLVHHCAGDGDDFVRVELQDSTPTWLFQDAPAGGAGSGCGDCTDQTVGGPTDTWGGTWTEAHIKSSSFRLRLTSKESAKGAGSWWVDYVQVTVYYTPGAQQYSRYATAAVSVAAAAKRTGVFERSASASVGTAAVAKRLKMAFREATAAISTAATSAREIAVSRATSAAVSLTGATARAINFSRKASAAISATAAVVREIITGRYATAAMSQTAAAKRTGVFGRLATASISTAAVAKAAKSFERFASAAMSLVATAKRLPLFLRAKSAAVSFAGVAKREIVTARSAAASMTLTAATARLREVAREASAAMSLVAVAIREALFPRSASAAISTSAVALRKKLAVRAASASMGMAGVAQGFKAFFRSASASIGLTAATAKQVLYKRGVTGAISLVGNAAREAVLSRAASAAIGTSAAAKGFRAFFREASAAMSLAAATAREIVVSRTAPASVSMVGNAARQVIFSRLALASMGLTGATARMKHGFRSAAATMSATGATARSIIVSRIASSSMGVVAAAKRTFLASRVASAVMGLVATATRSVVPAILAPPVQATLRMIPQETTLRLPPASLTTRLLTASKTPLLVGGGELTYTPLQTVSRMVLPADYVNNKLHMWNQKKGPLTYPGQNPWRLGCASGLEPSGDCSLGTVGMTLINSGTSVGMTRLSYSPLPTADRMYPMYMGGGGFNWVHDKDAHKFSFEFYLDNDLEETSSTEIYDDDETFWTALSWGTGSIGTPTISEELTEVVKGSSSLKVVMASGSEEWGGVYHDYSPTPQDWSAKEFICVYIYGTNSSGTFRVRILDTTGESNYKYYDVTDDFAGFRRFVIPINKMTDVGSPDLSAVRYVTVQANFVATWYLDRTVVDVGQWVKLEVYVPDQLNSAIPNIDLYAYKPSISDYDSNPFWKKDVEDNDPTGSYNNLYLHFMDGNTARSIYDLPAAEGMVIYYKGERGETKSKIVGPSAPAPQNITYSSYYGCQKRIGFAFKMPPDDGQDSSTAGISQTKLKLEVYYEGELTVEDTAGDNDGTRYFQPVVTAGRFGNGIEFDGIDDYVAIPDAPSLRLDTYNAFSIELWVKLDGVFGDRIMGKETDVTWKQFLFIWGSDGIGFHLYDSENTQIASDRSPYTAGDWAHLVGVWTGSQLRFYRDGALIGDPKDITSIQTSNTPIKIGAGHVAAAWVDGIVDEVRIYSRALGQTEIQANMSGNVTRQGLVSEWKFEDDWDYGRTTYEFEDSLNQYYGLQNINEDWLCLFHEDTGVVEWLKFDHTPIKLTVSADENEEINQLVIALSDPILSYDMETLTSDEKMQDLSGEGHHGTLYGTADIEGIIGRAREFNGGGSDYIAVPIGASVKGLAQVTLECWFKTYVLDGNARCIYMEPTSLLEGASRILLQLDTDDKLQFGGRAPDSDVFRVWVDSTKVLSPYTWYHLVAVFDSVTDDHKLYLNAAVETNSYTEQAFDNTDPIVEPRIGLLPTDLRPWYGIIDGFHIYPYAMTQAQVEARMKRETRIFSGGVRFPDLTLDTNENGIPDFLETFPPFELPDYIPVTLRRVR